MRRDCIKYIYFYSSNIICGTFLRIMDVLNVLNIYNETLVTSCDAKVPTVKRFDK